MATFGIRVFKHHEKKDGTFNVKIRITQERRSAYIDTSHFVTAKMLSKNYEVKDTFILKDLYGTLSDYREAVSRLGSKVNYMDADDIKAFWKSVFRCRADLLHHQLLLLLHFGQRLLVAHG